MQSLPSPRQPPGPSASRRHGHTAARYRQRGVGLLEVALVVLLIGSVMAAGFLVMQSRKPAQQVAAQEQALQWADQALVAYAATHARLPCAVSSPTSDATDCVGPNQKGWLPVRALEAVHPTGAGPGQPLRYMVYRGSDPGSDLATASNQFNPRKWDGSEHEFDAVNGLDLCAVLANAARETATATKGDRARTTDIDGTGINVAYGLSAAGSTPGSSGRFDGRNQQSTAAMESPARGADSDYDDRVRVRDFNALAQTLGCGYANATAPDGLVLASLDMLALAVDVSDEVDEQHEGNQEDTELAVIMAGVSEAFAIINVALAAAGVSNSASTLATASAQLATAIGTCVVLVGCALIPPYTGAVISGGIAVGLAAGATALAAIALGLSSAALGVTIEAQQMADVPLSSPANSIAEVTEQTCLSADGGWRLWDVDPDTKKRFTIDPPGIYQEGLLQQVEEIEEQLVEIQTEIDDTDQSLTSFENADFRAKLFDYNYGKPGRGSYEEGEDGDTAYNAALKTWEDSQPGIIKRWKRELAAKLEAIRKAEDAHYTWEIAAQAAEDAKTELDYMHQAIVEITVKVVQCDNYPPTELQLKVSCENNRNSLKGLQQCDPAYAGVNAQGEMQCLGENQKRYDQLAEESEVVRATYVQLTHEADARTQPPLNNHSWWCAITSSCQILIIPFQDDDDERETYARTYYQRKHLVESLRLKEVELTDKQGAYATAKAQCEALKNMDSEGGSSSGIKIVEGVTEILRTANCRGATGAVQPEVCNP
ncbi:hypothetical protein [Lysobacter sp. A421]